MKIDNNRALVAEKKHYIIPATNAQPICQLGAICVGSIHGEEGLQYRGGSDGSSDDMKPF